MRAVLPGLSTKFGRDLVLNLAAFVIMGVSGIGMNVIIGQAYGPTALGVFNQLFAVHILLSQLAVVGIHFSVLRHIPEHAENPRTGGAIVASALIATAPPAFIVSVAAWMLTEPVSLLLKSEGVRNGMPWIAATVSVFAFNKILMNALNGVREMRAFAIAQGGRFVVMLALLSLLAARGAPSDQLVSVILGAEIAVFLYTAVCCARRFVPNLADSGTWIRRHLKFGAKGFLSGSMSELNSRVDVIILGIFANDAVVGVYSFAATVAEGFSQIPIVLRNNLNPLLTKAYAGKDLDALVTMASKAKRGTYSGMGALLAVAALVFPLFVHFTVYTPDFAEAGMLFAILCAGLWLGSGYMPLDMYLVQCGYPGWQSGLKAAVLVTNIALNFALVPAFGALGAALAMAATWSLAALYVRQLGRKVTGVAI